MSIQGVGYTENCKLIFLDIEYDKPEHIVNLSQSMLSNPNFPWKKLIHCEGIGFNLRERYKNHPEQLNQIALPWAELPAAETAELFKYGLLDKLSLKILKLIAPKLTPDHLSLMSHNQLSSHDFPWEAFLSQSGFGLWLRNNPTQIIYVPIKDYAHRNLLHQ